MKRTLRVVLVAFSTWILLLLNVWVSPSISQPTFVWNLHGTVFQNGHAYAILQNKEGGKQQRVGVGEVIDEATVIRIERDRVELLDRNNQGIILSLAGFEGKQISPLISSSKDMAGVGINLNVFLDQELRRILEKPLPTMTDADRQKLVGEVSRALDQGKVIPASTALVIGGGEEWVTGLKTTASVNSMGLQEKDLIIAMNGISAGSDKGKWEKTFETIKRAKVVTFCYLRGEELTLKVFEVH